MVALLRWRTAWFLMLGRVVCHVCKPCSFATFPGAELIKKPNIDGFLVGGCSRKNLGLSMFVLQVSVMCLRGASLKPSFMEIIQLSSINLLSFGQTSCKRTRKSTPPPVLKKPKFSKVSELLPNTKVHPRVLRSLACIS